MTLWVGAHQLSFHPVKFGGHRFSDSGDIMIFVCHMTLQDICSESFMTLWLGDLQGKSSSYQVLWPLKLWQWRYNGFSLSLDLARSCKITQSKSHVTLWVAVHTVNYHPAKFGGHGHFGSGVKMILVHHVILQDHVLKVLCDLMGGRPLW